MTQFNMFFNALYAQRFLMRMTENTTALATLPLFHSFGQTGIRNAVLSASGTIVLLPRFVPTMYFALLHYPEADSYDLEIPKRELEPCRR